MNHPTGDVYHHPDSFKFLRELPDKSFDVTITDPPYSEHVHNNLVSGSLVGTKSVPKYELKFAPLSEYSWLGELLRVTKRWVAVFCSLEDFGRFEQAVGRAPKGGYVRSCIWYKSNACGQLTGDRPASAYEGIALLHPGHVKKTDVKMRWNGKGSYAIWKCSGTRGKPGRHPNEKPDDLCLKLTSLFSEPGETIFDPFSGSAAIGEAALKLGRSYVGVDNDMEWVEKGQARLLAAAVSSVTDEHAKGLCRMKDPVAM